MTTLDILKRTKAAWPSICNASAEDKNRILSAMADSLQAQCDAILRCNAEDMDAARGHISDVMLDRLYLDRGRVDAMADGIRATVALPDHTGRILAQIDHPNGMKIYKKQVPLGLVAIIYESRPNVTSDAAALAIKSGNVCMLRSGKEAFRTAKAIVAALKQGIASVGGDADIVNIVEDTSHESATEIMQAKGLVDLLIPRGGAGLIRACVRNATVPCIETGTGICHVYVDQYADLDKAVRIIENAKTSRPSVCNAEEVCLVHRSVAAKFLPMLKKALADDRAAQGLTPVELRLDAAAAQIIDGTPAGEQDFDLLDVAEVLHLGVQNGVRVQTKAVEQLAGLGLGVPAAHLGELGLELGGLVAVLLGERVLHVKCVLLAHDGEQTLVAAEHRVENGLVVEGKVVLLEHAHARLGRDGYRAGGRVEVARQNAQEGGLAGAVRADDAVAVALREFKVYVLEQRLTAEVQAQFADIDHVEASSI